MNKIDTKNWKEFEIIELFDVKGSKTTPLDVLEMYGKGEYPYITTKATNNGVEGNFNFYTEEGNVLTIDSAVLGHCTYQEHNFSASDHIEKLIPKFELNRHIAMFLVPIFNYEKYRYNYGRKCSQDRIKKRSIFLPTKNGKPDYKFMGEYIKSIYKNVEKERVEGSLIDKKLNLSINDWKWFELNEIFSMYRGKRQKSEDRIRGNTSYYSASDSNNGLTDKISNPLFTDTNKIIFTTFGDSFYVEEEFTASDEVNILNLKNNNLNKYNGLFLSLILKQLKYKYNFGRKAFSNKLCYEKIQLPTKNGKPDYKFMEEYIKSLEYSKSL